MTEAEYFEIDARSPERYELCDGRAVAVPPAEPEHGAVVVSLATALRQRRCLVWATSQRVHVEEAGLYAYPDVVVAGRPHFAGATLLDPVLIAEVLSPATEAFDRGVKFERYQRCASLREYVLVTVDERRVERFSRQPDATWLYRAFTAGEALSLPALDLEIPLAAIYDQVELLRDLTGA
jgi:Uma2 family endonuclease